MLYKVDVYQGNLLDVKQVEQLKVGMTKKQVTALLGTPSVADPFHEERWDYIATISKRGAKPKVRDLVLTFDGDALASIEGDYFEERDEELAKQMRRRYGNLPRDKDKPRRPRN